MACFFKKIVWPIFTLMNRMIDQIRSKQTKNAPLMLYKQFMIFSNSLCVYYLAQFRTSQYCNYELRMEDGSHFSLTFSLISHMKNHQS